MKGDDAIPPTHSLKPLLGLLGCVWRHTVMEHDYVTLHLSWSLSINSFPQFIQCAQLWAGTVLNFFVGRKEECFHVMKSTFYFGVTWWTHVSSPVMILIKNALLVVSLYQRRCPKESPMCMALCCSVKCFGIHHDDTFLYPSLSWIISWTLIVEMFSSVAICQSFMHRFLQVRTITWQNVVIWCEQKWFYQAWFIIHNVMD
jgi:hypothetical protein